MLLVKSRESKNSNKARPSNARLSGLSLIFCTFSLALTQPVLGQDSSKSLTSSSSILSVFLSLLVVIAIIFAIAFVMRRFNVAQAGHGKMRVVASMMAGSKEKIMVIQVGDEQHLLGITTHNINHLAKLDKPISTSQDSSASSMSNIADNKLNFQQKLVKAMAHSITPNKDKTQGKGDDRD